MLSLGSVMGRFTGKLVKKVENGDRKYSLFGMCAISECQENVTKNNFSPLTCEGFALSVLHDFLNIFSTQTPDPKERFLAACREWCVDNNAQKEKKKTLEELLDKDASLLYVREKETGKLGMHLAAESGNHILLEYLLRKYNFKREFSVDSVDSGSSTIISTTPHYVVDIPRANEDRWLDSLGRTALHYAAMHLCEQDDCGRYKECVEMLLGVVELNLPDKDGYTALTYAVTQRHKDRLLAMLNSSFGKHINLDISTADGGHTARSAINKFYPEMSERLHQIPEFSKDTPENEVLASLIDGKLLEFKHLLSRLKDKNPHYDEPFHAYLVEIACALQQKCEFLEVLLTHVSPNVVNEITKKPLLHLTVENAKKEALELLLKQKKIKIGLRDKYGCTALHHAAKQQVPGPRDVTRLQACIDMLLSYQQSKGEKKSKERNKFQKLFNRWNKSTGATTISDNVLSIFNIDNEGNTPLHLAARFGHEETVKTLLKNDANLLAMNSKGEYALTAIDADVLRNFLDDQIESANISIEDRDFYLEFNYKFLNRNSEEQDVLDTTGMKALSLLSEREHLHELLKHPILESFLILRWEKVRYFFYINVLFTTVFILLLSSYVLVVYDESSISRNWYEEFIYKNSYQIFIVLILLGSILALRELVQFMSKGLTYLLNLENYLELAIIACTFLVLFSVDVSLDDDVEVRKYLSPLIILLAWTELVMISGRTPLLSPQLEMLKKVSRTFLQYMPWYMLVILAFNLSFYSLFRDHNDEDNQFVSPVSGFFKTLLMMTGEFDMQNALYADVPYLSHIVFIVFVFLVAIVMLNLLSGLAVGDTNQIRQKADILSLVYVVKLVVFMEEFASSIHINMVPPKAIRIFPQKHKGQVIFGIDKRIIHSALNIVALKKKSARNKSAWSKYFRKAGDSSGKLDENTSQILDSFDKRLRNVEDMLKQLIALNGVIPRAHPD